MKKIFLLLFNILLLCSSIFAQASRFAFKCKLDEDSLVFIKTGNIYVQFKDNINSAERTRITNFFIDKGIQSEYVSDMIVRLKTSVNPNSVGSLSNILSDDFILCSSEELIYPVDSTIQWAGNDIFVQLKDGVEIENLLKSLPVLYTQYYNCNIYNNREYVVTIPNYDAFEYASMLLNSSNVEYAVPSFYRKGILQNPCYGQQWNLKNTGQHCNISGVDINVEDAWTISTGTGVKVAVVDNGVQLDHIDLVGNITTGYDALGSTYGGPSNGDYHGTCCAGIIAAKNNNIGVKGIAYNSTIIPIRMHEGRSFSYDVNCINSINYAVDNGADVINCSWGGGSPNPSLTSVIISGAANGRDGKGCVFVFSSGNRKHIFNDNNDVRYPATLSSVISVGAIAPNGKRKSFTSCDGESWWGSCYGDELDVVAPGVFIPTTTINNDTTLYFNGTSAAAPHVSGVAALMLSVNPYLTSAQVKKIIEQTAQKVGGYNYQTTTGRPNGTWCPKTGYGLIDAYYAVATACYYGYQINGPSMVNNACQEYTYSLNMPLPPGVVTSWYAPECCFEVISETSTSITVRPITSNYLPGIPITVLLYRPGYHIFLDKEIIYDINGFSCESNFSSTADRTISTPTNISGTFTINSGHTVTITSQVKCMPDTKIVINPGGKLIVDGGTISNYCTGRTWNAIYVVGNTYQRQLANNQGTLEVKNNSVIENSSWGIVTWNGTSYGTTGGIVKCTNSTFRNNGRQVEFYPYINHTASNEECNNVSYLKNCNFIIDDNNLFSSSNVTYTDMIKMSGVNGVAIRGCHFSDARTGSPTRGNAIHLAGAGVNIKPSCSYGDYTINMPCSCMGESRNTFSGFTKGIYAENTGTNYPFSVFKADFEKCQYPVFSLGVNNYKVIVSDFDLTISGQTQTAYGIFSSNSTGYTIEGNDFYRDCNNVGNYVTFGVFVQNSGNDYNTIYRNNFEKLADGIYSSNNPSLQILCNEFSNSFFTDIYATSAISILQGAYNQSAGNKFTMNMPSECYNIYTENPIVYYHSGSALSSNSYYPASTYGYISKVDNITANECEPTICIVPILPPINPPINPKSSPASDDISLYESLQQEYDSRLAEYDAAGYGFLLENFDEEDADIVALARLKQDTLITIHRAMAEIANRNIDAILQDTLVFDREALNGWYNRINTQTAKYSLVNSYFEVGEYALARQELASIPQRFALTTDELAEYDNFCKYQSLRESVYSSRRNFAQLTEDEIAELQRVVECNTGVSSAYANSVLCFFYGICRDEELDLDFDIDAPMNSKSTTAVAESDAEQLAIYVYPNPADEELNILLNSLPEGRTTIEFHDVTGRLVLSEEIKGNSTSINISSLRQGVYMYRIVNGDNVIARDRIVKE
jgi:subtilisin family serine protease